MVRLRKGVLPPDVYADYRDDPAAFVRDRLKEFVWSKQRDICRALVENDRVAVPSCHSAGKSFLAGRIGAWHLSVNPPGSAFLVTTAPSWPQVRAVLWREINRAHRRGGLPGQTNQTEWWIGGELVGFGRKPDDHDMTAFQGMHARKLLVILDEACGVPTALWNAAETLVSNERGKILAIGNPDDPNTEFGRVCKPGSGYHVEPIDAFESPNFTGEEVPEELKALLVHPRWAEERRVRWGENSPLYVAKVRGRFPEASDDSLIAPRHVAAAVARSLPAVGPCELGVDVARSLGGNESVIYSRVGPVARLRRALRTRDLTVLRDAVLDVVAEMKFEGHPVERIKIDDPGVGGGLTDMLNELARTPGSALAGVEVVPVNVGLPANITVANQTPDDMARFENLKAELNWALKERFEAGEIDLGDDEDTQAQICEIKYFQTRTGKVRMETKDELVKRLVGTDPDALGVSKSPDRWDALVLAFADVEVKKQGVVDLDALAA